MTGYRDVVAPSWLKGMLRIPGLLVAACVAGVATVLGRMAPVLGAPVCAIVLGIALSAAVGRRDVLRPGIQTAGRFVLQLSVVLLGAQLSLRSVLSVGVSSLPVLLTTLASCLLAAWLLGRRLGVGRDLRTLIGVGTGICGASAIAAVSPVIAAVSVDVSYAISTIFVFNVAAVLIFPAIGHLLGLSQQAFGLFAGTAVNDTSSVVAASSAYGAAAANHAVVVKLTRTLMIIPIVLALARYVRRRPAADMDMDMEATTTVATAPDAAAEPTLAPPPSTAPAAVAAARRVTKADTAEVAVDAAGPSDRPAGRRLARAPRLGRLVPWFLVGFLLLAAVNSVGLAPASATDAVHSLAFFLIAMAIAGIGLSTDVAALRRAGGRPLLLGAALWVVVATVSLLTQLATTGL